MRLDGANATITTTLSDLRRAAPVFYPQAKVGFEEGNLAATLDKIGYAIEFDDTKSQPCQPCAD